MGKQVKPPPRQINSNTSVQQGISSGEGKPDQIFPGMDDALQTPGNDSNEWNQQLLRIAAEQGRTTG
jgi:hypothetical protein